MTRPRIVDLFTGAGGLALGFQAAGCDIVAAADTDQRCGVTFLDNFSRLQPDSPPLGLFGPDKGDVSMADLDALSDQFGASVDILVGGPPCQGFSRVGRAKLNSLSDEGFEGDPRNELYRRFLDAAATWRPRAVVMENVPGMLSVGGVNVAEAAAIDLSNRGYEVGYAVLNAVWYGVPQYRERFFLIGIREDLGLRPEMPVPSHRAVLPSGYLRPTACETIPMPFLKHYELPVQLDRATLPATTVREGIGDLPELHDHEFRNQPRPRGDFRTTIKLQGKPHSGYAQLMRQWPGFEESDSIDDHAIRYTPRDYETFRRMKPGDRYPEAWKIMRERLDQELERLSRTGEGAPAEDTTEYKRLVKRIVAPYPVNMFIDKWRKLTPGSPSWTVPAHLSKDSYSHIHYDSGQARSISVREAARLQSFPDAFRFSGNLGECFRQIGNAVPPLLAWALAARLLTTLGIETCDPRSSLMFGNSDSTGDSERLSPLRGLATT